MDIDDLRHYLSQKKTVTEDLPFGPQALVFKVAGKMFALIAWEEDPLRISLKCEPEHALALRNIFPAVQPAYHMNKEHWNMVILDGSVKKDFLLDMIDDSYDLVVKKLKKTDREKLKEIGK